MAKIKRLSDYTDLDEAFVTECREAVLKLEDFVSRYVEAQQLDTLEQISELENIKRQHGAYLTYAIRFFSQISMYRENGEFMASERKGLKSRCIEELIKAGSNATASEKIVYNSDAYKSGMKDIQEIRKFLIYIWETYDLHKNVISRSIHQSLSTLQKEAESLKRTQ